MTFLLDLMAFPEKLPAGDLVCDGYEPWDGIRGTCGNFYCQFGTRFCRVGTGNKTPKSRWDFVVKERRSSKRVRESTLNRRFYVIENKKSNLERQFGALLTYEWKGELQDVAPVPHGNAKQASKVQQGYTRTAPSILRSAEEKIQRQSMHPREILEETNRESGGLFGAKTPASLLREGKQVSNLASRKFGCGTSRFSAGGKPKQSDYDKILKQCLSGGFVKVFELCNRLGVPRAPMPHLLCAQDRQLMMIRMFAAYKPLQGFPAEKLPDKHPHVCRHHVRSVRLLPDCVWNDPPSLCGRVDWKGTLCSSLLLFELLS